METKVITCKKNDSSQCAGYIIKGDGFTFTVVMDDDDVVFTYGIMDDKNHYQRTLRALKLKFKDCKFYNVEMDKHIQEILKNIDKTKIPAVSSSTLDIVLDMIGIDDEEDSYEVQTIL